MKTLQWADRERIESLSQSTWDFVFHMLDSEINVDSATVDKAAKEACNAVHKALSACWEIDSD